MIAIEPRFWDHLRQSGLLDHGEVAELQSRFSVETPVEEVTSTLISEGLLTSFQAKRIAAGDTRQLVLGQYRVVDQLGRGGFAYVYKAVHAYMNRTVAIKVITPELAEDTRARTWFEREVHAVTQLCHPNIVMAYDANEIDGQFFMVMEYVDGMNLDAVVRHHGPLSARSACEMLQQAARGLQYAHEKGLVHRDIKPANLLAPKPSADQPTGEAVLIKIADFGLARLHNNPANTLVLRNDKCFVGTPDYIAPEQARKVHEADIRSDLYSLGCSFYFALTGQRPFKGENPLETVMMHMEKEPMHLSRLRPELPAALTAIVHKLMAKDPAKRFQTPADLASELTFVLSHEGSAAPAAVITAKKMTDRLPVAHVKTCISEMQPTKVVEMPEAFSTPLPGAPERGDGGEGAVHSVVQAPTPLTPDPSPRSTGERGTSRSTRPFADLWREWTHVVEMLSNGKMPTLDPQKYRELQSDLLTAVRAVATATPPSPHRPTYARVESLVRPWLSLQALAAVDRQALCNLNARCQQISERLGVRPRRSWTWVAALVACLISAGMVGYLVQGLSGPPSLAAVQRLIETRPAICIAAVVPVGALCSFLTLGFFFRQR